MTERIRLFNVYSFLFWRPAELSIEFTHTIELYAFVLYYYYIVVLIFDHLIYFSKLIEKLYSNTQRT